MLKATAPFLPCLFGPRLPYRDVRENATFRLASLWKYERETAPFLGTSNREKYWSCARDL